MPPRKNGPSLTHLSAGGDARMVDVSVKAVTERAATATAAMRVLAPVLDQLFAGKLPKGDALATARVAGIQAAKRTGEWIPLCHPLALDWVHVDFSRPDTDTLRIECSVKTCARTGVEMEALVGASAAALTVYDMVKSADKGAVIGPIQLERKTGGRSGTYRRSRSSASKKVRRRGKL